MPTCDSFYAWEATRLVLIWVTGVIIICSAFGAGYKYHHATPCHCGSTDNAPMPRPIMAQPPSMARPTTAPTPAPFPARPRPLAATAPAVAAMVLLPPPPRPSPKAPSPKAS
ncbi:alpha carbonic anhydrase 8-like [Brachypodium distachyon]|uniref:alpha carbonic anhydrase 8-like n=1 Tax=Brachypodium distachyon TaxID=15368 RepID=UPI00052FFCF6|nr:alpha carbonic anhydrase 8-like [Brachypodium distachyon]|eukprot:XP_010239088.1 alpha carbonic anhydrase 8-like [Brachypodium distachyon]